MNNVTPTSQRLPGLHFTLADILKLQIQTQLRLVDPFDALLFLEQISELGDMTFTTAGPINFYLLNSPELVRELLVEKAAKFKKGLQIRLLGSIIGEGLLLSEGDFWKRQRKLAQPAFHSKRIYGYAETMVKQTETLLTEWQDGQTRMIDRDMMRVTLEIVVKTLFGTHISEAHIRAVADAMDKALHAVQVQMDSPILAPKWLPTPNKQVLSQSVKAMDQILLEIIAERRQSKADHGDLLSMLILAVDEEDGSSMTNEQLRDEAMTIFLAGHETTANALAWTFYLLGENPQIAAKVTEELDRVLGGRLPTLADLKALPYLAMVFKETLRLYPPAPGLARQPIEDVELGGHRIPVDATVSVSIWALHRNPRLWADPLKFDPERFNATNEPLIPKYAYLPFGGGPRVCIGNMFAEMEALLVLATILSRYTLETAPNHPVKPQQTVTLRPKHGMKMILHTRKVTTPDHWVAAQPALTTPV